MKKYSFSKSFDNLTNTTHHFGDKNFIFDNKNNTSPNLINPGDTISFFQISKSEFEKKYD